jgi:hypothetical protein
MCCIMLVSFKLPYNAGYAVANYDDFCTALLAFFLPPQTLVIMVLAKN